MYATTVTTTTAATTSANVGQSTASNHQHHAHEAIRRSQADTTTPAESTAHNQPQTRAGVVINTSLFDEDPFYGFPSLPQPLQPQVLFTATPRNPPEPSPSTVGNLGVRSVPTVRESMFSAGATTEPEAGHAADAAAGRAEWGRRHGAQRGAEASIGIENAPAAPNTTAFDLGPEDLPPHRWNPVNEDRLAEALSDAIDRLAVTLKTAPRRPTSLPTTYSGQEYEDPKMFLADAEYYCRREGIEYQEWTMVIADRLRGQAHAWYENYRCLHLDYDAFRQRLLECFDNPLTIADLQAKATGKKQETKEDTTLFISRKLALFRRVFPEFPEMVVVQKIQRLLLPEIKMLLREEGIESAEQLIRMATSAEQNFKETAIYRMLQNSQAPQQRVRAIQNGERNPRDPPYPCRFCGGNHFHRDCPRRALPARADANGNPPRLTDRTNRQNNAAITNDPATRNTNNHNFQNRNNPSYGARPPLPLPPASQSPPRRNLPAIMPPGPDDGNQVNYSETFPLPRLPATINGVEVWALVDTGASLTFVAQELVSAAEIPQYGRPVRLASGREVLARGPIWQEVTMGGQTAEIQVYAMEEITNPIILGQPWLHQFRVTIDYQYKCLYFGINVRSVAYWDVQVARELQRMSVDLGEENVAPEHHPRYQAVVDEFADVFQDFLQQPRTQFAQHEIRLRDPTPFKIRRYQYSPEKKQIIQEEVSKMLAAGVIRRSHSAFSSPVVIVRKKDGTHRFCVDYRQLNAQTEDEVSQLPPIAETLRDLGGARVFTSLDLRSGYWQVPMHPDSIPYTAFTTPDGACYEFLVMPFGLKCAPTTFQHLMIAVLAGYIGKFVKVYLDDIIIYSNSHEEHEEHLKLVLERLRIHGLKCSLEKCKFGADALDYLGHHVTATNNQPQERHVARIQDFPTPKTMKELQSFIGTANWLRDYVPDFAKLAAPLTDLIGKKKFRWTAEAEEAFRKLKTALSAPLSLCRPDFNQTFYLATDASKNGMGAVLYQLGPQGEKRIISCASAKLSKTERNYHINEQELLAVVWSIKRYRQFLEDRPFVLVTDSKALQWLKKFQDERAKLTRWALLLQEYSFTIVHRPGRENNLPDFLSRHPPEEEDPQVEEAIDENRLLPPEVGHPVPQEAPQLTRIGSPKSRRRHRRRRRIAYPRCFMQPTTSLMLVEADPEGLEEESLFDAVSRAQRDSVEYRATRARWHRLHNGQEQATESWQKTLRDNYTVEDDLIWYTKNNHHALVVPLELWPRVIYEFHDSPLAGHPGRDETLRAMQRLYHWPAMTRRNSATGVPPSQLLLGVPLVRPGEWRHPNQQQPPQNDAAAREQRVRRARERQIVFQRHLFPEPREAPRHFQPGDQVLIKFLSETRSPFSATWTGPHSVISVLGDGVYEVDRNGRQERYHVDDLRPAPGPAPDPREDMDQLARPFDGPDPEAPLQGGEAAPDDAADEAASQASESSSASQPDELIFPGPSRRPSSPQPGPSRPYTHEVTLEDASDSDEDEPTGCSHMGTPIVGLWP